MKIALNLSTAVMPRERYALAWALPTALIAVVGLCYFSASAVKGLRTYQRYHREAAECQKRERQLREREAALRKDLEQPQFRNLLHEAQFVNSLIEKKQLSLTKLTAKATKLLPADVRLTALAFSRPTENPLVRFSVEGKSEETIETFLSNLEDSSDFTDVTVTNQGLGTGEAARAGVVVTCTALYVGEGAGLKVQN